MPAFVIAVMSLAVRETGATAGGRLSFVRSGVLLVSSQQGGYRLWGSGLGEARWSWLSLVTESGSARLTNPNDRT